MKEKINNLDEVVSLITKKVAERLGGQEQKKSHNETEVAKATDYDQKLASMIE